MIRLSWRQFRTQAVVTFALLAVIAVILAITGPGVTHFYDANVTTCGAHHDCDAVTQAFLVYDHAVQAALGPILLVLPALIGMFWGAPLIARELETGTFRLAWTQSLTRNRWLAVKLALSGLIAMAAAGLLSLMVSWWFSPLDRMNLNRLTPGVFGERGIAPIGYAAFAFAFGVAAGAIIRRTVPAMAATLVTFLGARLAMTYLVRPRVIAPVRTTAFITLNAGNGPQPPGTGAPNAADWVLSSSTINGAGRVIGQNGGISLGRGNSGIGFSVNSSGVSLQGVGRCPNIPAGAGSGRQFDNRVLQACIDKLGIRQVLSYQPISRYWALQGVELAVFLALGLALAGLCFWWIRRRLT